MAGQVHVLADTSQGLSQHQCCVCTQRFNHLGIELNTKRCFRRFLPAGLASHLLLHLGGFFPAREWEIWGSWQNTVCTENEQQRKGLSCVRLIYLLNCDELCYLRQVLLYQLLVLEHYLGGWSHCDSQSTVGLLDNNPVSFSTCCLARGVVLDQVEKADFADSTARSISLKRWKVNCMNNKCNSQASNAEDRGSVQTCCVDWGTLVTSWLVAGLSTSTHLSGSS